MTTSTIDSSLIANLRACRTTAAHAIATDLSRFNSLAGIDPEMAMVRARRALDLLVRSIATGTGVVVGTKSMEHLLTDLRKVRALPAVIERHIRVVKDFGNIAAHGVDVDEPVNTSSVLSSAELGLCAESTSIVMRWYLDQVAVSAPDDIRYLVRSGASVTQELLDQALSVDELVYREQFRGRQEICRAWLAWNADIYTLLVDPTIDRVVGYINAMPLEDDVFRSIEAGQRLDVDLPTSAIRRYEFPDFYLLYISSIAIHPSYQSTTAFKALFDAFVDRLLELARREIYFTEIIADAVTPEGERACRFAGMTPVQESEHDSRIFKVTLLPPALRVTSTRAKALTDFYRSKYEEFRTLLSSEAMSE